jgi:hypothetical protein
VHPEFTESAKRNDIECLVGLTHFVK